MRGCGEGIVEAGEKGKLAESMETIRTVIADRKFFAKSL
jgi:hypothetical protein